MKAFELGIEYIDQKILSTSQCDWYLKCWSLISTEIIISFISLSGDIFSFVIRENDGINSNSKQEIL